MFFSSDYIFISFDTGVLHPRNRSHFFSIDRTTSKNLRSKQQSRSVRIQSQVLGGEKKRRRRRLKQRQKDRTSFEGTLPGNVEEDEPRRRQCQERTQIAMAIYTC